MAIECEIYKEYDRKFKTAVVLYQGGRDNE